MRFITNEKLDEYCFKNRLIPPKLRRSLYTSAEITGFQPPTPTTFKSIGNKNKLFELKYFQEFNQPESVKENVGLQIFNALQMLPKNEDSSVGRARQILADGVRYQAQLTRENNIKAAKEKVSSEIAAVFKAKKARLEQQKEFLKQQEEKDEAEKALEEISKALKGLDEVANLAGVKIEPTPPKGPPPPGGLRGRGRSTSEETEPLKPKIFERSQSAETAQETPGAAEIKQEEPEPNPQAEIDRLEDEIRGAKRNKQTNAGFIARVETEIGRREIDIEGMRRDLPLKNERRRPRFEKEIREAETALEELKNELANMKNKETLYNSEIESATRDLGQYSDLPPPMPEQTEL
tara:strand:+ start:351 stop:1400 length:1050 start_codon:yes stop_codon:yes gene_type:complete